MERLVAEVVFAEQAKMVVLACELLARGEVVTTIACSNRAMSPAGAPISTRRKQACKSARHAFAISWLRSL